MQYRSPSGGGGQGERVPQYYTHWKIPLNICPLFADIIVKTALPL